MSAPVLSPRYRAVSASREIATRVATERIGLFPDYFIPLLESLVLQTETSLRELPGAKDHFDLDLILQTTAVDMVDTLYGLNLRSLVWDFHRERRERGAVFDASSGAFYADYESEIGTADFHARLGTRLPVLERLNREAIQRRAELMGLTARNFLKDRDDLLAAGLAPQGPVTALRASNGDLHNGGRTVVFVETETGGVVHKPRPMHIEHLAQQLFDHLNPWLRDDAPLLLPRLLTRPEHGWQEKVAAKPVENIEAARRFSYRMGALSVAFGVFGSTDLHCDNVIAWGDCPAFVDLETLFQLRSRVGMENAYDDSPRMPVLETGLLPYQVPGMLVDIDISGIGRLEAQTSVHTSLGIVDERTDAVRIDRIPTTIAQADNLLTLGGRPLPVRWFPEDFEGGLRDGLLAVRRTEPALRRTIEDADFHVRQVLRPTVHYGRILAAATHPDYLVSDEARSGLLRKLKPISSLPHELSSAVHRLEVAAMERGDVPYFQVRSGSRAISAPADGSVEGTFHLDPKADTLEVIDRFMDIDDVQHRHLALMSLVASDPAVPTRPVDDVPRPGGYLDELLSGSPVQVPIALADLLRDLNVCPQSPAWMIPNVAQAGGSAGLGPATPSLYEGGGIPLLLTHTGRRADLDLAREIFMPHYLDAVAPVGSPLGRAVFSGSAAAAYLLDEISQATGDSTMGVERDRRLASILTEPAHKEDPRDLIGGIAGTAAFISSPGRADLVSTHREIVDAAVVEMLAVLREDGLVPWEFAHGKLGVAWALARVAAAIDHDEARHTAAVHLESALGRWNVLPETTVPRVADSSWCKGDAGALIALGEGLLLVGHDIAQVRDQIEPIVIRALRAASGIGRDLSPCHGVTGTVQALTHLSSVLGHDDYRFRAARLLEDRLNRVRTDGYNGGLRHSQGHLTYMTGLAGIAHTCVIVESPDVGSPVALTTTSGLKRLRIQREGAHK